jgi:hypothetical protein
LRCPARPAYGQPADRRHVETRSFVHAIYSNDVAAYEALTVSYRYLTFEAAAGSKQNGRVDRISV